MEDNFNLLFKKTQIMVREISILLDFLTSILWLTDVFMKTWFFFLFVFLRYVHVGAKRPVSGTGAYLRLSL